jgi:hypothetical protein
VGDDKTCAVLVLHQLVERLLDDPLRLRVERRRRLVKQQAAQPDPELPLHSCYVSVTIQ